MSEQFIPRCVYHAHALSFVHAGHPCTGWKGSGFSLPASLAALTRALNCSFAAAAASAAGSSRWGGVGSAVEFTMGPQGRQRTASGLGWVGLFSRLNPGAQG